LISDIIKEKGEKASTRILDDKEFIVEIAKKMVEEAREFQSTPNMEELADILEVIHGALNAMGETFESLELLRDEKRIKRGGFDKRIFLESVTDESDK